MIITVGMIGCNKSESVLFRIPGSAFNSLQIVVSTDQDGRMERSIHPQF